jgi:hypothetical protein
MTRSSGGAGDFDARLDRQIGTNGPDVEARIVDQALEVENAALDCQFLTIGIETAADGANRTVRPRHS